MREIKGGGERRTRHRVESRREIEIEKNKTQN